MKTRKVMENDTRKLAMVALCMSIVVALLFSMAPYI